VLTLWSKSYTDGRQSKFLVRETRTRNLIQETCIQVAHRTIQVSRTRNMAVLAADTDNDLAVAATTVLSALSNQIKRKPKRDKWVQPWIVRRPISVAYHALLHGVFSRHLALHKN